MSKEKLPTAEKVLAEYGEKHPSSWSGFTYYHDSVLLAMEEYKDLHTAPLQARIEELEAWSKQLGEKWDNCRERKNELYQEIENLKKELRENEGATLRYKEYAEKKKSENERLREALEWYADSGNYLTDNERLATAWSKNKNIEKKAKEALKGGDNDVI